MVSRRITGIYDPESANVITGSGLPSIKILKCVSAEIRTPPTSPARSIVLAHKLWASCISFLDLYTNGEIYGPKFNDFEKIGTKVQNLITQ